MMVCQGTTSTLEEEKKKDRPTPLLTVFALTATCRLVLRLDRRSHLHEVCVSAPFSAPVNALIYTLVVKFLLLLA